MMSDAAAAPEASNGTAPAEEASSISALRDNIASKGKNAYYYAHSHKADGPAWDGKPGEMYACRRAIEIICHVCLGL